MKNTRQPVSCQHCGVVFMAQLSKINNIDPARRPKYCSRQCRGFVQGQRNLKPMTKPNQTSFKPGQMTGKDNPMYVEPVSLVCENCESIFALKPWILRQKGNQGRFCSTKCRGEYRAKFESGPNSSMWVGGPRTYRGHGWIIARQVVVVEQEGKCARCGNLVGKSLPVHHKRPFREFATPEEANVRSNLIGLCQSCHMHMEYHASTSQSTG